MIKTTNYLLNKPSLLDKVDVTHLNENSDIIDAELKRIDDKSVILSKASIESALGFTINKNVPANAIFTDTIVDISGKADKSYVDGKVKTDVPLGAIFTDTKYKHPSTHTANMIVENVDRKFVNDNQITTWDNKQDKLVAGPNINITEDNVISSTGGSGSSVDIEDSLVSSSIVKALSARQGKVLDGKISTVSNNLTTLNEDYDTTKLSLLDKANKSYVDNLVNTPVPVDAVFIDTVTSINGKTGVITKEDIVALGIPAQDTIVDAGGMVTQEYVDNRVKTPVPLDAKFTDNNTEYIAGSNVIIDDTTISAIDTKYDIPTKLPADGGDADTVGGFTVSKNVPFDANFNDTQYQPGDNLTLEGSTFNAIDTTYDLSTYMEKNNDTLGAYTEKLVEIGGTSIINLEEGNVFVDTPSSNRTYSIANVKNGEAHSFTLRINQPSTVRTLTFPASVNWGKSGIPDMTTPNKTYILTFMTVNGGNTWEGMFGGEF